jgi:hypothetical protein
MPRGELTRSALVITGAGSITEVSVRVATPVPPVLVALRVTGKVPVTVGIPLMRPVLVLIERPAGNPRALKLVGEFVAVIE